MKYALAILIWILMIGDIFDAAMSLGPGLSIKNATIYIIAALLIANFAIRRNFKAESTGASIALATLLGYSLITWFVIVAVLEYPGYDALYNGLFLKAYYGDFLVFFLVFLYAVKTRTEVYFILYNLVLACAASNLATLLDGVGIIDISNIEIGLDGRVQGVVGVKNSHAAYVLVFLPLTVAVGQHASRLSKWILYTSAALGLGVIIGTASRGAFVGLIAAVLACAIIFRRYITRAHIAKTLIIGTPALITIILIAAASFSELLESRFVNTSTDTDEMTSGRVYVWGAYIRMMVENPIYFITGMGWQGYLTIPYFQNGRPPHNEYIYVWFHLGLIGIISQLAIFYYLVKDSIKATVASALDRPVLIASVFGTIGLAVAIFFTPLYAVWPYYWALMGTMMRLCAIVRQERLSPSSSMTSDVFQKRVRLHESTKDSYGWSNRRAGP